MFLSDALGMGLCFHKCFEVCKTLSHPFLPLNLRAVQQINQGDKITEPPSTGTESPTLPDCLRESGMVDPGPRIPTPLLFLPCQCHFTLSMFSLPRHPKQRLSSLTFQGDMGCFYPLNSSSFLWGATSSLFLLVLMSLSSRDGLWVSQPGPEPLLPHSISWFGDIHMETKRLQVFLYSLKRESWLVSALDICKHLVLSFLRPRTHIFLKPIFCWTTLN